MENCLRSWRCRDGEYRYWEAFLADGDLRMGPEMARHTFSSAFAHCLRTGLAAMSPRISPTCRDCRDSSRRLDIFQMRWHTLEIVRSGA